MGKHSAADDSTVHPLVAEALSRRAGAPGGSHDAHTGGRADRPEPEHEGGGALGWPDDTVAIPAVGAQEADRELVTVAGTVPDTSRRGWRRLCGASPAA